MPKRSTPTFKEKRMFKRGEKLNTDFVEEKGHRAKVKSRRKRTLLKKAHEFTLKTNSEIFVYIKDEHKIVQYYASDSILPMFQQILQPTDTKIVISTERDADVPSFAVSSASQTDNSHLGSVHVSPPSEANQMEVDPNTAPIAAKSLMHAGTSTQDLEEHLDSRGDNEVVCNPTPQAHNSSSGTKAIVEGERSTQDKDKSLENGDSKAPVNTDNKSSKSKYIVFRVVKKEEREDNDWEY